MDSVTIVAAALDSKQLEQSINNLVATVASKTKEMADNFTKEVGRMEQAVKNLGNIKIDSGGTADGGSSRRTSKQKEEETQVKATTQAYKEQSVSLDHLASAQQKAIRLPSEMRMPDVAKSARESFQAFYKGFNEQARQIEPLIQSWEKLLQARHTGNIEQVAQKIAQVKHEIAELVKEQANLSKTKPQGYLDEIAKRNPQIKALREQLISLETEHQKLKASDPFKDNPYLNTLRERLQGVKSAMNDADTTSRRLLFTTKELTEEQKKLAETSLQKSLSHAMKIPTNEIDLARAKLESLQGLLIQMGERGLLNNSQKFKINEEIQRLVNFIADADSKQSSLISGSKRYTEEIRKQAEAIKSIDNQNKAKSVFASVTQMDANNIEQLRLKLNNLLELKNKVAGTPLLSKSNLNMLDWMIGDVKRKISEIGTAQNQASNQQKKTLDDMNAYMRQNIQREQERREAIRQTGLAAQDAFAKIRQNAQIQLTENTDKPIRGIKELADAITNMRRLYFDMSTAEKESPLGLALKRDIENAQKLKIAIDAYNRTLKGMSVLSTNNNANSSLGAYTELTNILKTLSDEYKRLGREERNAAKGNDLADKIQRLSRATQKIQQQMNRPISFEAAMKGSEKTLDDIAYKMQRLRAYKQGIDLTKPNAANEIRQVDEAIVRLQKDMDKYLSKSKDVLNSNNALGRSWNYMKNRLAFYFTVGASTQFIKNLIEVRSQYEMNERALGILINSAERGTQIFNELSQMALVSPYTLIELSAAAKQLTAYDIAAKDVVDTTRRLADMASAVGVPIERLTYALGQIKAYGYLNSRDARMFANAGIPLVRELSKYYSELEGKVVSVGDVYDRMKKKSIDYNSVMAVVTKMTDEGGKFFDFQAKMANTLKVQLANLTLAWNNMLNDLGASQQGVLVGGIAALKNLFLHWQDIYDIITKVAYAFGLYKLAQATTLIWTGRITTAMGMQELVGKKLQARLAGLAAANKSFVAASTMGWMALAAVVVEVLYTWNRNVEEIERLNKTIADGAKESAKALDEFINSSEMSYARLSAQTGKLPKAEAEKTWESLREQIELSSMSSDKIIPKLLEINNLNERLTTAFDLAERIKDANEKLSDLEDSLDVSQDSILGGLLGEGLIEDIEDYNEHLAYSAEKAEYFTQKNHGFWENAAMGLKALYNEVRDSMGSSTDEAEREITNFARNAAQTIKDELGEEGLKDKIQVNEAIARVVNGVEQMFPKLRGKGKMLFETMFNDVMAKEFNGAVDKQAYYYKLFLERLKKDHGSAFQGVTDDILKETHKWSTGQQNAINKTAEKVKKDLPLAAQDAIDEILSQLNKTDFKLRIVTEFATTTLDDVQKQFKDKFISKPWIADQKEREKAETEAQQRYGNLMRKTTESNVEYEKRVSDERKKQLELWQKNAEIINANENKQDALSKAIVKDAQEQKKASDDWLKAAKDVEDVGGYDFSTKKENAAASKAQKAAETELQKALKDELQLIDKVRGQYKKLTDAGATDGEALAMVTNQFANSLAHVNNVLGKNGIPLFDITKFAGTDNPNALLDMLKLQLDSAKIAKNIKPEEIKELEVKYSEIVVDAKAYNLTKITKGLNNELDRLKEEYELAVSLDADPELGNMFADWMGIDVNDLPRTASEYAERASKELNKYLKKNKTNVELPNLLNITDDDMRAFEENKTLTDTQIEIVRKRVQQAREIYKKEVSDQIKDWDKLLEKYAEYQTKVNKIHDDAVKERVSFAQQFGSEEDKSLALNLQAQILAATDPQEKQRLIQQLQELVKKIAGDDKTKINLVTAINNNEQQGVAKANFEEYQKSPEWIAATGDLAGMTTKAIGSLISSLERYKKSAKNLDPKQIKQINSALRNLHRQQRQGNPFLQIADAIDRAKERADEFKPEMKKVKDEIAAIEEEIGDNEATEEQAKQLKTLKERWKELASMGEVSATEYVNAINSCIAAASQAISMFTDMADALGGKHMTDATKTIKDVVSVLDKAGQGAALGAQIGGGSAWGALIGGVAGGLTGLISTFADQWSGNAAITEKVEESVRAVKRLEVAYVDLQQAVDKAYGTAAIGAKHATLANKELQLAELQRQIQLEKSRSSKNRDEDKIIELQKQYKELFYEIQNGYTEIVDDLMGTDVASFAENLVSSMIDAFKQGEDYMQVFSDKFDEMIDNMIMKSIVSRVVSQYLDQIWDSIDERINDRSKKESEDYANAQNKLASVRNMSDEELSQYMALERGGGDFHTTMKELSKITQDDIAEYRKAAELEEKAAKERLDAAAAFTGSDVDYIMAQITEIMPELGQKLKDILGEYYKYGESSETQLSALQQGIAGISEDTAGALEAYMNGVSQQVYLQSDLLTQIRDAVVGFDLDVQVATMSQILLQLQSSYTVQMSIQGILEGVLNPSGRAFTVELLS